MVPALRVGYLIHGLARRGTSCKIIALLLDYNQADFVRVGIRQEKKNTRTFVSRQGVATIFYPCDFRPNILQKQMPLFAVFAQAPIPLLPSPCRKQLGITKAFETLAKSIGSHGFEKNHHGFAIHSP